MSGSGEASATSDLSATNALPGASASYDQRSANSIHPSSNLSGSHPPAFAFAHATTRMSYSASTTYNVNGPPMSMNGPPMNMNGPPMNMNGPPYGHLPPHAQPHQPPHFSHPPPHPHPQQPMPTPITPSAPGPSPSPSSAITPTTTPNPNPNANPNANPNTTTSTAPGPTPAAAASTAVPALSILHVPIPPAPNPPKEDNKDYKPWKPRSVSMYEREKNSFGGLIGEGTYGSVFSARAPDGERVALKRIRKEKKEGFPITAIREITILKALRGHANIVQLKDVVSSHDLAQRYDKRAGGDTEGHVYMVFEYCDHDLTGLMESSEPISDAQIKYYMKCILEALAHCHMHKILHRDIKGANVLISNNGDVKLADFGLARLITRSGPLTNRVVTLWYRAPELLLGEGNYTDKVDMWSVGCVFAELLTHGKILFPGNNTELDQLSKIFEICGSPTDENWPGVSKLKLWEQMAKPAPRPRRLRETFIPNYHADAVDLLDKLLALDPSKRLSAAEALQHRYFKNNEPPIMKKEDHPKYRLNHHEYHAKRRPAARRKQTNAVPGPYAAGGMGMGPGAGGPMKRARTGPGAIGSYGSQQAGAGPGAGPGAGAMNGPGSVAAGGSGAYVQSQMGMGSRPQSAGFYQTTVGRGGLSYNYSNRGGGAAGMSNGPPRRYPPASSASASAPSSAPSASSSAPPTTSAGSANPNPNPLSSTISFQAPPPSGLAMAMGGMPSSRSASAAGRPRSRAQFGGGRGRSNPPTPTSASSASASASNAAAPNTSSSSAPLPYTPAAPPSQR